MWRIISSVFFLHVVFLLAMFDIFFRSPIMNELPAVHNTIETPARRLVLFVGDGLRADTFFEFHNGESNAPFLRELIDGGAPWGVSHSRVPTESRPGHVALIAGFYEDPSAVFKGWKENPVPFDSVFNRTSATFSWGSPDIVTIFTHGSKKVFAKSYEFIELQFDGVWDRPLNLNKWVMDEFQNFLTECTKNETLNKIVRSDKVLFFLHLIGIDMAGHTSKPDSDHYRMNVKLTDSIVNDSVSLINRFFQDNRTAFIFTADHGMSNWGSHGAGTSSETETPIVAWGAGIKQPECSGDTDIITPNSWRMNGKCRQDVNQADIAVLMSVLLGISIPTNSIGILPFLYLNFSTRSLALSLRLNAQQLLVNYHARENRIKEQVMGMFFKPFRSGSFALFESTKLEELNHSLAIENFSLSADIALGLIKLTLLGIDYYHSYYQNILMFFLVASFLGLNSVILCQIINYMVPGKGSFVFKLDRRNKCFIGSLIATILLHIMQSLPSHFLLYNIVPMVLWGITLNSFNWPPRALKLIKSWTFWVNIVGYSLAAEILFLAFFYRWVLSIATIGLCFWPFVDEKLLLMPQKYKIFWVMSCLALTCFPLLPVLSSHTNIPIVCVAGGLILITGIFLINQRLFEIRFSSTLTKIQVYFTIPTVINVVLVAISFNSGLGLPLVCQITSFFVLITYFSSLVMGPKNIYVKFVNIAFSLSVPFLLFSVSHESLLPLALSLNLILWILFEQLGYTPGDLPQVGRLTLPPKHQCRPLTLLEDFRRSFLFLFYIIFAFFAVGNVDSLNSFDTNWVRCFITSFSPFSMTGLILLKTIIPFLLVSVAFRIVVTITEARMEVLILIVLFYCEQLGVQFLFLVQNTGSWLDIGRSISHYVIIEVIALVLVIFYGLATIIVFPPSMWFTSKKKTQYSQ